MKKTKLPGLVLFVLISVQSLSAETFGLFLDRFRTFFVKNYGQTKVLEQGQSEPSFNIVQSFLTQLELPERLRATELLFLEYKYEAVVSHSMDISKDVFLHEVGVYEIVFDKPSNMSSTIATLPLVITKVLQLAVFLEFAAINIQFNGHNAFRLLEAAIIQSLEDHQQSADGLAQFDVVVKAAEVLSSNREKASLLSPTVIKSPQPDFEPLGCGRLDRPNPRPNPRRCSAARVTAPGPYTSAPNVLESCP